MDYNISVKVYIERDIYILKVSLFSESFALVSLFALLAKTMISNSDNLSD